MKDGKSKKLAQVMTNDSSRKILDYLGRKEDATESEIAKELDLPVSTVNYNMKQLVDAGFLTADEYHYSEKGKEVTHYKLANKLIVIAPKTTFGFKQKLRSILPVGLVGAGIAILIKMFPFFNPSRAMDVAPQFAMEKVGGAQNIAEDVVRDGAAQTAEQVVDDAVAPAAAESVSTVVDSATSSAGDVASATVNEVTDQVVEEGVATLTDPIAQELTRAPVDYAVQNSSYALYSDIAIWFFFGVLTTIALILLIDWARSKR